MNYYRHFIILQLLFSISLSEITVGQKEKLLNGFINFYNGLPGQLYKCDEGSLENTQQVDDTTYQIVANLKVNELNSPGVSKLFKCTAKLKDSDDGVTVENNHCEDQEQQGPVNDPEQVPAPQTDVTEEPFERKPIKLENEVQSDTGLGSGEQFIAIPRDQPNAPCVGCASHVSPQAAGVTDLANLGIRHLDIHEPSVKHSLDSVLDVERQVQVVNGVRYILTLSVIFNKCDEAESQDCASSKICRVTILVKPWVKLPNGKNYRAILANNCTQEWQYGDDGEVLPEQTNNNHGADDDILVKNIQVLQTQPNKKKVLSDEDIRLIQEQIIPNSNFEEVTLANHDYKTTPSDVQGVSKQHVFKLEANKQSGNSIPVTESIKSINQEKKKAIDEMLDFFDFSGFKPETDFSGINPRIKRSYENDLQVLSLAEEYHKIKKSIENAKFVYEMAQAMVDYLNEMDIDVKTRVVQEVMKAEEETENFKRFVYVQARVTIPCDKIECEPKDGISQICNGVIDSTNELNPQILNTFCYNSNKEKDFRDKVKEVYLEDPVLQTLAKEAVRKIEFESKSPYAIKMKKIVAANTQTTSGALTKISLIIENLNCNKTVPFGLRINCTVLELLGSKICEVLIHERYWLQEKKISYTCTDRPVDMKMSKTKSIAKNITVHDPKIIEMLQESIQYLETQSNKNNKQKIVNITSISTQIVAGFLTKLEFIVGYTNCTNENDVNCELLENENLRVCKAQIWDRSWIIDGKQIEILCNDMTNTGDIEKIRGKRSIDVLENQKQHNVNNITYKQLAEDSLKKYLQSTSSKKHYVVESVDKVKTVSAMLTLIDFTITPTNCLIEKDGKPALKKCEVVNFDDKMLCHSKILGQSMLHTKQYFVSCVAKYQFLDGNNNLIGLKDNDPSDSKYYRLANESLTKYFKDIGISRHHRIVRVEKVTTQIVSGLLTSIEFIISPNESNSSSDTIKCHSQVLEKHWLKSKNYDVTCEIKEKKNIDVVSEPENQKLTQIAVESLQEYIRRKPDSQLLRVTFVDKATFNPSGTNILEFLASHSEDDDGDTFCHAEYTEKSLVRNYITVKCDSIGTILKKSEITGEDPNYFQYIKLAEKSLKKYLQSNNKSDLYTIVSIENINMKWDKGIKTEIQFIVSPIDLENNEFSGLLCTSQIREQPWLSKEYVNITCTEDKDLYRVKRQLGKEIGEREVLGGESEMNPNDPQYKALADESLQKYLKDNDISEYHKVDRVVKVTTQVVSGSLTRLVFVISNGQDLKAQECHSGVWEQQWLDKKEIKVSCALLGQREKRQKRGFVGGQSEKNPDDPQYKALADESLQKYLKDNGISEYHKVDRVVKVTTQIVSGSMTRLDFVISNEQDLKAQECHSEVWEQVWLNKKEITVSCAPLGQRVERLKRELVGGLTEKNPNEPQYKALADESLQKYLKDNGISEFHKVDRVVKVTTHVVSGSMTRLDFVISNGQDLKAQECHSKVWEQVWLNKKEITVSCALLGHRVERQKRELVGGESERNPNDPQYKTLADESLQKYLKDNDISEFHKVDRVVKVTTQVVSGSMTRLDFVISNGQDLKAQECHSKVWEQVWLNKKEITVSCALLGHRVERQKRELVVGGESERNPNDPQYKALADESLQKYLKDNDISEFHKVDRVVKVTTQVVSGSMTRLDFVISNGQDLKAQECHSEVWEQVWLNKKEITVSCTPLGQRVERQKRELVGGLTEKNPNEPQYKALADESLQKYLKDNGISEFHKVDRVVKVTTQVVSGSMTRLDFVISNGQDLKAQECHSKVWEQVWLNKKEITVSCALLGHRVERQKRELVVGGESKRNPNDPQYKALADESLQKYLKDNDISEFHKVDRVVKVTTQVVSGSMTRLDFVISNGQDLNAQECHSKVWEQVWLNKKEITVSCALLGHRVERQKRELVGGESERNPNDPQYKTLAEESLQKYLKDNDISEFHKVDRVVKVTTQVVSGSMTRLDFVISNGQDLKAQECHSKVWEQVWLNKKEITVSCALLGHRVERQKRELVGGESERNPNDPQYKALADESLQKYLKDNDISEFHKVDRVVKVTTQVVSGSMTRLDFVISNGQDLNAQECHSKVWEQVWLNKKEITVSCALLGHRVERQKRELVGGESERNPNDPQYKTLAEESLQKYLKDNDISEFHKVDRVVKVTTQVVSGSMTRLDFVISNGQDLKAQECHSKVWEQVWLNKKEITVSCALLGHRVERQKRELVGGESERNPNDPQYKTLADESLQKYLKDNDISEFHKVDRVVKVTTQVVSGSMTRLDFVISNGQDLKAQECHSKVWEQVWLNKKEITVSCALLGHRVERQKRELVVGGESERNPNDPQYKALADESLQKYLKDNDISEFHKVDRVVRVSTQVVSGSLTRLDFVISNGQDLKAQECHSEVWEQLWLNKKEITVSCALLDQRGKHQKNVFGGETDQNPNEPQYKALADESLQKYLKDGISEFHKVDRVVKVTTQVVSGSLTRLVFVISNGQDMKAQECHSEVWEQLWLNKKEIKVSCALLGQREKRQKNGFGGETDQNPNEPQYKALADESLQKYLKDNGISEFHKVDRVVRVSTQVVSGSLTRLDFVISNGQDLKAQECHSEVWEQLWLNKKEIKVSCALLGQREKRQKNGFGGETDQNPNEPQYKTLAEESLQKYLKDNDISEYHKVDRVVRVSTQVVSGSLTRLVFVISNGQDFKAQECHSEVWEQLWLNKKEIKVSCALLGQREKRQKNGFGGETDQNPNEPQYKALADKSLQKYLKDNGISEFHKVDRVVKVTTQVVSGSLTRLDFVISNGQDLKAQECHSEVWEQLWLNKKEIKVSCALLGQREKRQKNGFGGETDQNPNEPQYKALADESLQKYLKDNGISEFHKVDRVVRVSTQVVSGSLTRLDFVISNGQDLKAQECHSEVWEQLWLNKKEIKVSCALLGQREKRQKNGFGGETDQNPNEPQYKTLAEESLQKYLKDNDISEYHKVDRVVRVSTQVVSGSLTRLVFVISNGQDLKAQECHSEVWEQLWLNKKEIKVSCALLGQREKRQKNGFGGETDQNPNEPQYKALADKSLQKYLKDNGISEFHKVDRVVKVTTQVVSGSLTRLDFVISNGQDLKAQECHSEVWEQMWLNKKEIKVSCALLGQREKRQKNGLGGETDQNPNEPQYKALADESLQKYLKDNGISEFHKVDRVVKVTTQVVSGSLTRLDFVISNGQDLKAQECHSEVWEQLWLNKKEIKVSCALLGQREKRQKNGFGGETDQNPNEPQYKALADESLQKYLKDNGISEFHKVDRVVRVSTQVVSGSLTRLDFVISNRQDLKAQECHSEVWEQLWLNKKEIKVSCALLGQREKRQKNGFGGETDQNPNEPQYKTLAEESLQKYLKDSGISEFHKVDRVVKVTTQVVSGSLTRLVFVISNGQDLKAQECHSEVWEQLWLNKIEIKVSCALLGQREKRQKNGLGGETDQNPNEPQYKALADESLQKYLKDSGISEFHKVDRVVKVTTQVVSGSLTRLFFVISNGQDLKAQECHSEVWEQQWLNKKEIKVSCALLGQREKRQKKVFGGETDQNPSELQYKALADESLQKYLKDNGISEYHKVDRVVRVSTQVVSGSLTRLVFVISNGQDLKAQECHSEVWEQLWLNKKEIKVSCALLGQREKRQKNGSGGETDQNPNEPQYKALADESLQKYLKDNGISEFHKVDRVVKVTTQVVSGSLTRLVFVISNGQDLKAQECHSEVWEQLWLNKKEIKVSCALLGQREKRQKNGLGGETDQNPNEPQYKALADESLQKYLKDSGISEFHKVDRVVKVTTQVVSGSLTRLVFVISNGQDLKAQECHSEVWEQLWLNKIEIKVSCALLGQREKRQKNGLGGETDQNPNEPQYKALADESLQKYLKDSGISEFHKVDRVVKVTTQVVSGSLTRLFFVISNGQDLKAQECHSEVWEQQWLNKKEIKVSCALLGQREKRQKKVFGGETDQNPSELQYKALADESLQKYLKDNGISEYHKVDRVVKVTTQVVSGSLTRLVFVISNGQDLKAQECHSEVWEQQWLNKKEIKVSCALFGQRVERQKRGFVGGQLEKNPDDPQYKALADESLQKYLKDNDISEYHKVDRVVKVTTQVVSGLLTRLDFVISNGQNLKAQECHSEVWEQPWLSYKSFNISCGEKSRRSKRQARDSENNESSTKVEDKKRLRGSEVEQDAHKAEYKVLAKESLRKYQSKGSIHHKVLEVKRVLMRVVSGIKYKIDFTAAPTSCAVNISNLLEHKCKVVEGVTLYCHSEIWDRPWLKYKDIDVQCHGPDDNDFDEYETDVGALDDILKLSSDGKTKDDKYKLLAEEASEKYLSSSNRKYVHKITHIHSVSEHIADGNIIKLEFSMSPTKCLRNETRSSNDTCAMKLPLIVIHCTANIWDRPWLQVEKDIKTTCKKLGKSKKIKRELGGRTVRQTGDEDDIDEETTYYYADRAVQHVNDQSSSNNLHKLVTIHAVQNSVQMKTPMIRMYIELAETYCLRHHRDVNLHDCEEMNGLDHRLCLARLWPSPDDELVVRHVSVICDDDEEFASVTALNIPELLKLSIEGIERSPENHFKLIHQGEPQVIPALDSKLPIKLNFIIATTNCSKHVDLAKNPFQCYIDSTIPAKACHSYIWMEAETRTISFIDAKCPRPVRSRRSPSGLANVTADDNSEIQNLVTQSLEKLEMSSLHRYKQRVLQINSHSTKITTGKVTTIDFDVGYTSCLKYEWVENITSCDFLEHLPRRRCVAQIFERLWINNGKNIDVNCVDDETPLESHIEFESAEMANQLASEALKHIEAKYPHPKKQKVVRIFSLEKQVVAGIHYRMKVEVGFTDCVALSEQTDCKLENDLHLNKFCRVNVWIRPWTDHPPNFRVSCDYQEGATHELYHHVQAEHLFYNFLTTYSPSYVNDYSQMQKRFEIFKANVKKIHELNIYDKGTARYGVTRFTDLTYEEFSSRYMGLKTDLRDANQVPTKKAEIPNIKIPQNFDWREYDAVTDVKDQGSCGSCWAFSVTGNIEGQWKMQSGQLVSLSEQELVDCDKLDNGCNGGLPDNAYRAIEQLGGLEMEIDYPYEGEDDKCVFNKTLAKVQISGAVNITTNETGMAQWLVHNGPISIGINANAMQFYMGGISHPWKMLCNPTNLDHGVLIVGYGVKDYPLFHKSLPYWIVKNSWGKSWGEQGYYRVFRGDGTCGVNQMASSAVI